MKIIIVGAGPRGLHLVERLVHNQNQKLALHLFDPTGIGGTIWRQDQSDDLLMNSISCQVTLFTDDSLHGSGKIVPGPNLFTWSQELAPAFFANYPPKLREKCLQLAQNLGPNDCCPRYFYGEYQRWFFTELLKKQSEDLTITYHQTAVSNLRPKNTGWEVISDQVVIDADCVLLALGHLPLALTTEEQKLAAYANKHHLFYQQPSNPADVSIEQIPPKENVILRGLGLTFFDYIGRLFLERGGRFIETNGQLQYYASGQEVHLIVGSRRGLPYHARGKNEKALGEQVVPHFLTSEELKSWTAKPGNSQHFLQALRHELEYVYYTKLLAENHTPPEQIQHFQERFLQNPDDPGVLQEFAMTKEEQLNWDQLFYPTVKKDETYHQFIRHYLQKDIMEASKGTLNGPLVAAFDALKDLRAPVHFIVDHQLLLPEEYLQDFWGNFVKFNGFLSIGPPLIRIRQLLALLEAGFITFIPGPLQTKTVAHHFEVGTPHNPMTYRADYLIEARIPSNDIRYSQSALIKNLVHQKLIQPYHLMINGREEHFGAIDIDPNTHLVKVNSQQTHPNLYCYGIPVEGLEFLTAVSSRPGTNPRVISQANQIALHVLAQTTPKKF
ncbi:MAG: FAD/NAD(P)-binding protein [Enterococcus sp.]